MLNDFHCKQQFIKSNSRSSENENYVGKIVTEEIVDFNNQIANAGSKISERGLSCFFYVDDEIITLMSMHKYWFSFIACKIIKNDFFWNLVGGIDRLMGLFHTIRLAYYPNEVSGNKLITVVLIHGSAISSSVQ